MKTSLFSFLFIAFVAVLNAQIATPDVYTTKKGDLTIQPLIHASMVLTWDAKTIYIDPSNIEGLNFNMAKADVVFITDIHGDHLNIKSLKHVITPKTILVMPLAAKLKLKKTNLVNKIIVLRNTQTIKVDGIRVSAIAMYNLPEIDNSKHVKGRGNGYVLNFIGQRMYISGDTADVDEMRDLKNIDIAFVCMNLPYTMTVDKAANAVLDFKPTIVYPFHYRGKGGFSDVKQFKKLVNTDNKNIKVLLKNWYPKH